MSKRARCEAAPPYPRNPDFSTRVNWTPCYHLNEESRRCMLAKRFPGDCGTCEKYLPGRDRTEQTRCEVWLAGLTSAAIDDESDE